MVVQLSAHGGGGDQAGVLGVHDAGGHGGHLGARDRVGQAVVADPGVGAHGDPSGGLLADELAQLRLAKEDRR